MLIGAHCIIYSTNAEADRKLGVYEPRHPRP